MLWPLEAPVGKLPPQLGRGGVSWSLWEVSGGSLGGVLGGLGCLLEHLGGVLGRLKRVLARLEIVLGRHGSLEAVLDALRCNKVGQGGAPGQPKIALGLRL